MMPTALSDVVARVGRIQSMAQRVSGGFAGALGTAMLSPTPAPTTGPPGAGTPLPANSPVETGRPGRPPTADLPAGATRWQGAIDRAAAAEGVDPRLLTAVVWVESGFVPDAVSHAGAIGLAQLMPGTAEMLGVDPYDPEQNLAGGARFLRAMIDRFGRVDLALAAYNAGPARVAREHDGGAGVPVSSDYVETVLDRYRQLGGSA